MQIQPTFPDLGRTVSSDTEALMDLNAEEIISLFEEHGAVVFSGFKADLAAFEQFSNRFSTDYMSHEGGGSVRDVINRDGDQTIMSVAYAYNAQNQRSFPLSLHSDRSYTKSHPPIMWFCCKQPAKESGETTVADGRAFYHAMTDSTREFLTDTPIKYVRKYKDGEWQLLWQTDNRDRVAEYATENDMRLVANDDGSIQTEYETYAIRPDRWGHQPAFVNSMLLVEWQERVLKRGETTSIRLSDGSKIPQAIWDELLRLEKELTHFINWQPGDILMIDNTRMLHGRRAFEDPNREIWVRMCRSVDW